MRQDDQDDRHAAQAVELDTGGRAEPAADAVAGARELASGSVAGAGGGDGRLDEQAGCTRLRCGCAWVASSSGPRRWRVTTNRR